jgi:anti-sigma factor RsiW
VPSDSRHLTSDLVQEALDRRLSPERLAVIEAHLRECPSCRRSWDAFAWAKEQARRAAPMDVPDALAERIARSLDAEDLRATARRRNRLFAAVLAAGLAGLLAGAALFWTARRDPVTIVVGDHEAVRTGRLALEVHTADARRLQEHFDQVRLGFKARVFDLGMMKYDLVGGTVHSIGGRRGALFVYRGANGEELVCQMYPGSVSDLPAGGERLEHDGIPFVVYEREGLTLVFWPEGRVVCVLAGPGGRDAILSLAYAKAARGREQA